MALERCSASLAVNSEAAQDMTGSTRSSVPLTHTGRAAVERVRVPSVEDTGPQATASPSASVGEGDIADELDQGPLKSHDLRPARPAAELEVCR